VHRRGQPASPAPRAPGRSRCRIHGSSASTRRARAPATCGAAAGCRESKSSFEPLTNPDFHELMRLVRAQDPGRLIELTTNGARLGEEMIAALAENGVEGGALAALCAPCCWFSHLRRRWLSPLFATSRSKRESSAASCGSRPAAVRSSSQASAASGPFPSASPREALRAGRLVHAALGSTLVPARGRGRRRECSHIAPAPACRRSSGRRRRETSPPRRSRHAPSRPSCPRLQALARRPPQVRCGAPRGQRSSGWLAPIHVRRAAGSVRAREE
jgi:hypothetical protein